MDSKRMMGWCALFISLIACGSENDPATPVGDGGTNEDASGPDTGGEDAGFSCAAGEVALSLVFRAMDYQGAPLEGVHACVVTHPEIPCVDTGADGRWNLCAPASAELAITYEKPGFMPTLTALTTGTDPSAYYRDNNLRMSAESICAHPWDEIGEQCPPTTKALLFVKAVVDEPESENLPAPLGGVTMTLSPAAEIGPFYEKEFGLADFDATATHAGNGNMFAAGVTPGDDQVVGLSHATLSSCKGHLAMSWPGSTPGTIRVPIRAGFRTFATVTCN